MIGRMTMFALWIHCQCMLSHCYDNVKWDSLSITTPDSFIAKRRPSTTHTLESNHQHFLNSQIHNKIRTIFSLFPFHSLSVHLDRLCVHNVYKHFSYIRLLLYVYPLAIFHLQRSHTAYRILHYNICVSNTFSKWCCATFLVF